MIRNAFKIVIIAFLTLAIAACQKENDSTQEAPKDYSIQVIPNIHEILADHIDLINVMDTLLHFGDNPPQLSKLIVDTTDSHKDTLLGFCNDSLSLKLYLMADSSAAYKPSELIRGTYQFLFDGQHRGVSSLYFKSTNHDNGPTDHYIETAQCLDSVFIMGDNQRFTAFYFQKLKKDLNINGFCPPDPGAKEVIILSGKATENGIKDFYIGIKVYGFDDSSNAGIGGLNIGDIILYYRNFMPFTYWDPTQTYDK